MNINGLGSSAGQTVTQNTTLAASQEARQALTTQGAQSGSQPLTTQAVSQAQKSEATRSELEEATKAVNEFVSPINSAIQFALDEDSGATVIKVIDIATKDVIRQIPSEEMLSIAKAIDKVKGLLVQQKA